MATRGCGHRPDRNPLPQPGALAAGLQRPVARGGGGRLGAAARPGQFLLDLLVEHGRVLHGPRRGPDGPGRGGGHAPLADLMGRNLDHRIEILVPVEDARGQRELARTFDTNMEDTRWSWALRSDGTWERVQGKKGKGTQSLHGALMRRARARARRAGGVSRPR